jgi:pimeloyl-ACP methyl ester carboxylesterase
LDERGERVIEESGEFRSAEGRLVTFSRYGQAAGRRVVFHYGTPGTRHLSERATNVLARQGAQILVLDRPGYGESSRQPGRRVADVVDDVAMVADLHGWDRFAVWGGSGGGPHALACASLLADRVERCASVVGPAPYGADGLDWMDGMSPGNVEEFDRALEGEESYRPLVERLAREAVEAVRSGEVPISADYELPEADLAALRARLADPGYLERTIAMHTGGVDGWIDDAIALVKPWGFDPEAISVPVSIWYGPDDVLCPRGHAEWLLAHIPGAERRELPAGHILEDEDLGAIYGWLLLGQ